jgi:transcriptional regulator with XRE-family HTH domain
MKIKLNNENIKSQRGIRAWSQTQLADVSGLSLRTIQRIEKTGIASQESAKSLAAVYECSITELIATDRSSKFLGKFSFSKTTSKARLFIFLY